MLAAHAAGCCCCAWAGCCLKLLASCSKQVGKRLIVLGASRCDGASWELHHATAGLRGRVGRPGSAAEEDVRQP